MYPSLRDPPLPSGFVVALIDVAFEDDTAAKQGDGGLKTKGLGKMQDHDGQPVFVPVDGDDAPTLFNSTEVEDGGDIDPREDQAGPLRRQLHDKALSDNDS